MKKIGIIDYYLSQYHSNNAQRWVEMANNALGVEYRVCYAYAELDVSPDGVTTDEWCKQRDVIKCESIDEVCEKSDFIMIIAPDNSEKHLEYAKTAFKYGKRTFIDKTFAPDYESAKKIYELGEKYNTKFFSCSSLRFADELQLIKGAQNYVIVSDGFKLPVYLVHQVEMMMELVNSKAKRVKMEIQGHQKISRVEFENGKTITAVMDKYAPYYIFYSNEDTTGGFVEIKSPFFANQIRNVVKFFETGEYPFDNEQTLEIMRIIEMLLKASKNQNVWIEN